MKMRAVSRLFVYIFALIVFLSPSSSPTGQELNKERQPFPKFQAHLIDRLPGGYKVGTVDIDRDGKLDVIGLATTPSSLVWYKNPSWEKHVLTSRAKEYIDLAPYDIDRDGRVDMAVAHDFGMSRTSSGGLVHWLRCPEDPSQEWPMHAAGAEPTSHRIRWADIDGDGHKELVNAPIMGRDAKAPFWDVGVNLLWYKIPEPSTQEPWKPNIIDDQLTVIHGISIINWDNDGCDDILTASFEGIHLFQPRRQATPHLSGSVAPATGNDQASARSQPFAQQSIGTAWSKTRLGAGEQVNRDRRGSSEIAAGKIGSENRRFLAAIEPWHGNNIVVYTPDSGSNTLWRRSVIDGTFNEGHALTCADLDADGDDEIIAGYRGKGYSLYIYDCQDSTGDTWKRITLDEGDMAASGLDIADVNRDGRLDVICVGTATSNIKWYENSGAVQRNIESEEADKLENLDQ